MKIKGLSGHPISSGDSGKAQSAEKPQSSGTASAGRTEGGAGGSDTVSLTISATRLQDLQAQIASLPVADAKHIADVQRSLASGHFSFEPEEAAENLLTQEREFARSENKTKE